MLYHMACDVDHLAVLHPLTTICRVYDAIDSVTVFHNNDNILIKTMQQTEETLKKV